MKHGLSSKIAMRSLNFLNLFLFCVHIFFLFFFTAMHVTVMSVVNIFSVLFYAVGFLNLKKGLIGGHIVATFVEIMLHMFLAVLCLGWDYGFQLYFIGCIAIVFYVDYFSVKLGKHHFKGTLFNVISSVLYFVTLLLTRRTGALYEINDNVELVMLAVNSLVVFLIVSVFFRMLTSIAIFYEEELANQASHDMLTGLVNRYYLMKNLQEIYDGGQMSNCWLAILDIDNFKQINDTYGHNCGDYVLKSVAELIQNNCEGMTACRWGGEEFLLVGQEEAYSMQFGQPEGVVLERVRSLVEQKQFEYGEKQFHITVTIGVSRHMAEQSIDEWINIADKKLYHGKKNGKNQVVM